MKKSKFLLALLSVLMVSVIAFSLAACNADNKKESDNNNKAEVTELKMEKAIETFNDSIKLGTTNNKGVGVDYLLNFGKYQLQLQFALPNAESKEKNKYNIALKDGDKNLLTIKADENRAFVVCDNSKYVFTDLGANSIANMGANVKNGSMSSAGLVAILTSFFDKATYSNDILSFTGDATGIKTIVKMLLPKEEKNNDTDGEKIVENESGIKKIFNTIKKYLPALDDVSFALELNTKTLDSKLTATVNHFVTTNISVSGKGVSVGQMPAIEVPTSVEGYVVANTLEFNIDGNFAINNKAANNTELVKYQYELKCNVSAVELISNALKVIANGTLSTKEILSNTLFVSNNSRVYFDLKQISGIKSYVEARTYYNLEGSVLTVVYDRVNGFNDDINVALAPLSVIPQGLNNSLGMLAGVYAGKFMGLQVDKDVFKYLGQKSKNPDDVYVEPETEKQALNIQKLISTIFSISKNDGNVSLDSDVLKNIVSSLPISKTIMEKTPNELIDCLLGSSYKVEDENGKWVFVKGFLSSKWVEYDPNNSKHEGLKRYNDVNVEPELVLNARFNYGVSGLDDINSKEKSLEYFMFQNNVENDNDTVSVVKKDFAGTAPAANAPVVTLNADKNVKIRASFDLINEKTGENTGESKVLNNTDDKNHTLNLSAYDTYNLLKYGEVEVLFSGKRIDGTDFITEGSNKNDVANLKIAKVIGLDYSLVGVEQVVTIITTPADACSLGTILGWFDMKIPAFVIENVKITIAPDAPPTPAK